MTEEPTAPRRWAGAVPGVVPAAAPPPHLEPAEVDAAVARLSRQVVELSAGLARTRTELADARQRTVDAERRGAWFAWLLVVTAAVFGLLSLLALPSLLALVERTRGTAVFAAVVCAAVTALAVVGEARSDEPSGLAVLGLLAVGGLAAGSWVGAARDPVWRVGR
jgi:hypothetical protein